jgi:hypothetical protein
MADAILGSDLLTQLAAIAGARAVEVRFDGARAISGTQDAILSKWFLGGRKVAYRMTCTADEASRSVRFREAAVESSWGLPPPTLSVERTTQRGTRVSASRTDRSPGGGGGHLDYGGLRDALEQAVGANGWQFIVEVGKMP